MGIEKIDTCIKTVNFLLKSKTVNAKAVKSTSELSQLIELLNESVARFAVAVYLKDIKCGNAYPEERIKKVFTDDKLITILSAVCKIYGCEQETYLTELVQFFDKLLNQQHG